MTNNLRNINLRAANLASAIQELRKTVDELDFFCSEICKNVRLLHVAIEEENEQAVRSTRAIVDKYRELAFEKVKEANGSLHGINLLLAMDRR